MFRSSRATGALLALLLCLAGTSTALAARPVQSAGLEAELDAILSPTFSPDGPGAAVIVVKDGKTVYRKAYGLANLELETPMRPEMVFEIGSVTKQFTAAAIMMLVEQGKVALEDDIAKYFPDYPSKGAKITVEHLLTHTSGIKSYTGTPKWLSMWAQDMTPQQIIDMTKDEPLEFQPGTRWAYNNTGYVMLGAIIEKASGLSYADFLSKNIFEPLAMTSTVYGSNTAIIKNRAGGYTRTPEGYRIARYLSMTQPYAAGSIMSTIDDLAKWDAAISTGKLLTKASWDRVFTPYKLASGESTGYGFGWGTDKYAGHAIVRHNGGIPGFVSEVARLPEDRVYVALLTNADSSGIDTGFVTTKLAAAAIGKPYREPAAVKVDPATLDRYVGVYRIDANTTRVVSRDGDRLFAQRSGRPKIEIFPTPDGEFFIKDSFVRMRFDADATGKVSGMTVVQSDGRQEVAKRTDEAAPAAPVAIKVAPAVLAAYAGQYELAPGFVLTVTVEGDRVLTQATGQRQLEIFAKSETEFFPKEIEASITFVKGPSGAVTQLVLRQGGREMPAKKIK